MSGSGFRGRGFGPRGAHSNGPVGGFHGPRFPHPNFNPSRPTPKRLQRQEKWGEGSSGFTVWQGKSNFVQRPQFREGLPPRPNGRGRGSNGRGIGRFPGPGRPPGPGPFFPMGPARSNVRPRLFFKPDNSQEKGPRLPLPGSEKERQQKISETAEKLKQSLSSITAEEIMHFWDDHSCALPSSHPDQQHETEKKVISELSHEQPELNLTFNDLRDMGKVDVNKMEGGENDHDTNREIFGLSNDIDQLQSTNEKITVLSVDTKDTQNNGNDEDDQKSSDEMGDIVYNSQKVDLCNEHAMSKCVAVHPNDNDTELSCNNLDSSTKSDLVIATDADKNESVPSREIATVIIPVSVQNEQLSQKTISIETQNDSIQVDCVSNSQKDAEDPNAYGEAPVTNVVASSHDNLLTIVAPNPDDNATQVPSCTFNKQIVAESNLKTSSSNLKEGQIPVIERYQPNSRNGAQSFPHRMPNQRGRWTYPHRGKNNFPPLRPRMPNYVNQMPPMRPMMPHSQMNVPPRFDSRLLPPTSCLRHNLAAVSNPPIRANLPTELPLNFNPTQPPPNIRPPAQIEPPVQDVVPHFTNSEVLQPSLPPFHSTSLIPPIATVAPGTTADSLNDFNAQELSPVLCNQVSPLQLPPVFDPRLSSHDRSSFITNIAGNVPSSSTMSMNLLETTEMTDFNMSATAANFSQLPSMNMQPHQPYVVNVQMNFPNLLSNPGQVPCNMAMPKQLPMDMNQIQLPPLPPEDSILEPREIHDQGNTSIDDGLEDMQEAMEFAKQVMNMSEESQGCTKSNGGVELPLANPELSSSERFKVIESTSAPVSSPVQQSDSQVTEKETSANSTQAGTINQVRQEVAVVLGDGKTGEKEVASVLEDLIRPKVVFNLNSKVKMRKIDDWHHSSDEGKNRKSKSGTQASDFDKISHDRPKSEQVQKKISTSVDRSKTSTKDTSGDHSKFKKGKSKSIYKPTIKNYVSPPRAKILSNTTQQKQEPTKQIKKLETPTLESSWKSRVINRFLKMSKNDIRNMVNHSSLRKFDIAMKHLVKEKRTSLSLEMRNTEDEKIKGYDRDDFMSQLNAMLDPGATVDISNLPTEFIQHLNEVLQLDPMQFNSELLPQSDGAIVTTHDTLNTDTLEQKIPEESSDSVGMPPVHESSNIKRKKRKSNNEVLPLNDAPNTSDITRSHTKSVVDVVSCQHRALNQPEIPDFPSKDEHIQKTQKLLFNAADLDDILSVVTEKTKDNRSMNTWKKSKDSTVEMNKNYVSITKKFGENQDKFLSGSSNSNDFGSLYGHEFLKERVPTYVTDARLHETLEDLSIDGIGKYERWNRKERENLDAFRNLTKEEWEAKYGSFSNNRSPSSPRRGNSNSRDSTARRIPKHDLSQRHCLSESPRSNFSASPMAREPVVFPDFSNSYNEFEGLCKAASSPSSNSTSSSSSDDSSKNATPNDVTKLLKVIKQKEKIAKKMSLNEAIRDEVAAEIEKKRKQKNKRKGRRNSSKYWKHGNERKTRHRREKKRKRRKQTAKLYSSGSDKESPDLPRLLTENEIKKEVVVKEEEDIPPQHSTDENNTTNTMPKLPGTDVVNKRHSIPGNNILSSKPIVGTTSSVIHNNEHQKLENNSSCITTTAHLKTKAQLKQMPELPDITQLNMTQNLIINTLPMKPTIPVSKPEIQKVECSKPIIDQHSKVNDEQSPANDPVKEANVLVNAAQENQAEVTDNKMLIAASSPSNVMVSVIEASVSTASSELVQPNAEETIQNPPTIQTEDLLNLIGNTDQAVLSENGNNSSRSSTPTSKSGAKKIDIKAYKERTLQKRLKQGLLKNTAQVLTETATKLAGHASSQNETQSKNVTPCTPPTTPLETTGEKDSATSVNSSTNPLNDKDNSKTAHHASSNSLKGIKIVSVENVSKSLIKTVSNSDVQLKNKAPNAPADKNKFKNIRSEGSKELKLKKGKSKSHKHDKKKSSNTKEEGASTSTDSEKTSTSSSVSTTEKVIKKSTRKAENTVASNSSEIPRSNKDELNKIDNKPEIGLSELKLKEETPIESYATNITTADVSEAILPTKLDLESSISTGKDNESYHEVKLHSAKLETSNVNNSQHVETGNCDTTQATCNQLSRSLIDHHCTEEVIRENDKEDASALLKAPCEDTLAREPEEKNKNVNSLIEEVIPHKQENTIEVDIDRTSPVEPNTLSAQVSSSCRINKSTVENTNELVRETVKNLLDAVSNNIENDFASIRSENVAFDYDDSELVIDSSNHEEPECRTNASSPESSISLGSPFKGFAPESIRGEECDIDITDFAVLSSSEKKTDGENIDSTKQNHHIAELNDKKLTAVDSQNTTVSEIAIVPLESNKSRDADEKSENHSLHTELTEDDRDQIEIEIPGSESTASIMAHEIRDQHTLNEENETYIVLSEYVNEGDDRSQDGLPMTIQEHRECLSEDVSQFDVVQTEKIDVLHASTPLISSSDSSKLCSEAVSIDIDGKENVQNETRSDKERKTCGSVVEREKCNVPESLLKEDMTELGNTTPNASGSSVTCPTMNAKQKPHTSTTDKAKYPVEEELGSSTDIGYSIADHEIEPPKGKDLTCSTDTTNNTDRILIPSETAPNEYKVKKVAEPGSVLADDSSTRPVIRTMASLNAVPKKLNVPTKAALKDSTENLPISSTDVCLPHKKANIDARKITVITSIERRHASGLEALKSKYEKSNKETETIRYSIPIANTADYVATPTEQFGIVSSSTTCEANSNTIGTLADTKQPKSVCTHHNPIDEMQKMKGVEKVLGKKPKTTQNTVECQTNSKNQRKNDMADGLHKTLNKPGMKHKHNKKHSISEKIVMDAVKSGIVQVGHPNTKEGIMARMMEIDVEIHKLMTEKMTLYQMLQTDTLSVEDAFQSNSMTKENKLVQLRKTATPAVQLLKRLDESAAIVLAKQNPIPEISHNKHKKSLKTEHRRNRGLSPGSSEDEEGSNQHSEAHKNTSSRRQKHRKSEKNVNWQNASKQAETEDDVFLDKKQHSDATKLNTKKVASSILKQDVEKKKIVEDERKNSASSSEKKIAKKQGTDKVNLHATSSSAIETHSQKHEEKSNISPDAVSSDKSHSLSFRDKICASPAKLAKHEPSAVKIAKTVEKAECSEVNNETSTSIIQSKKLTDVVSTNPNEDSNDKHIMNDPLLEDKPTSSTPVSETRTSEGLSLYSDDSTWECFSNNPTMVSNDSKKLNTGLALLEKTYKQEIAKSRKLKAQARKKKKKQLKNLLQSVHTLTSDEEDLSLSTLYIKKLQQKKDLLDNLDHTLDETNTLDNPLVWQNVDEVINAVAEDRVEDLYTKQSGTNDEASAENVDAAVASPREVSNEPSIPSNVESKSDRKIEDDIEKEASKTTKNDLANINPMKQIFSTTDESYKTTNIATAHVHHETSQHAIQSMNVDPVNNENDLNAVVQDEERLMVSQVATGLNEGMPKLLISNETNIAKGHPVTNDIQQGNPSYISAAALPILPDTVIDQTINNDLPSKICTELPSTSEPGKRDSPCLENDNGEQSNTVAVTPSEEKIAQEEGQIHKEIISEKSIRNKVEESATESLKLQRSRKDSGHAVEKSAVKDTTEGSAMKESSLQKRKRTNNEAMVRKSSRHSTENVKRVRTETESSLTEYLEDKCLQSRIAHMPPTSVSPHVEDNSKVSTYKRRKSSDQKPQNKRKRSTSTGGSTVSAHKQATLNKKVCNSLHNVQHMMNCEVRLVDCKYMLLKSERDSNVLREFGVSRINVHIDTKERVADSGSNVEQSTKLIELAKPETGSAETNCPREVSPSIEQSDASSKITSEQNDLFKSKKPLKCGKENVSILDESQDTTNLPLSPTNLVETTLPRTEPIDNHNLDIEIVEEMKPGNNDTEHEDITESTLSVINSDVEPSRTQYTVHKGPILDIKVFGNSFLAASEDGAIYRYSQTSNGILNIYKGHKAAVTCLYVHTGTGGIADQSKIWMFSGSLDGTLRCYNIMTGAQMRNPSDVGSPVQCMDEAWGIIFIGTKSGKVSRYHIKAGAIKGDSILFSDKSVLALKATSEGPRRVLIVASRNQPITIRDAQNGLFLRTISGQKSHTVYSLMRHNNLIYCGTSSTSIPVFDFTNGDEIVQYNAGVGIVCMRLYLNLLFAGCYDGNIYIFNIKERKLICSTPGPGNMLLSMEIVDNKIIAGSKDKRLQSWHMPKQALNVLGHAT